MTEPLQAPVPNVAMNVVIDSRRQSEKLNVPKCRHDQSEDDNALGKDWRGKEFTDREEVSDPRERQGRHEMRPPAIAEVARADNER